MSPKSVEPSCDDFDLEENGEKIPDAKLRRKLQNRLNQRASRERRRNRIQALNESPPVGQKWTIYVAPRLNQNLLQGDSNSSAAYQPTVSVRRSQKGARFCDMGPLERYEYLDHMYNKVQHGASRRLLHCDLLLSVTQLNGIRAMCMNATFICLTIDLLKDCDIASPFATDQPWMLDLPPSLQPTALQKQVPHHPWIDLFPIPSIRDAMLKHLDQIDEEQLCEDLFFGSPSHPHSRTGLLVWGEPWDPSGYEFSENILRDQSWILLDASDVIQSTNYWRVKRGERPLLLPLAPSPE